MSRPVFVHLLPTLFEPGDLRGGVAVVIDVLRASTTICHAVAAGADCVLPCRTVEQARTAAANLPAGSAVLGGERHGVRIDGFDLGNSPTDYTRESVGDKTVVFTTTNGTAALDRSREADEIYVGSFVNLSRILTVAMRTPRPLHFVCAGTDGVMTAEDALCAGAVNDALAGLGGDVGNDAAQLATAAYRQLAGAGASLIDAFATSRGGRNLIELGLGRDLATAAAIDAVPVLPRFDPATGRIAAV